MIASLFSATWPYLVGAAGWALAIWAVRRNGKVDAKRDAAEASLTKQKEMRDANASVDRSRRGIADRLRDGRF
ncbi:hypothetical protein [Amaricoccus solimangrovi]|uniref:Uncharacterized protein n=1 Tax=Amaricoccus solimangrovi TaxID=2589815 RepID=A0A501VZS2_9RHOB|nr:hypothetical protein [Amaricoccus solimangrovi]TPE42929.1 hypothetical protein FJM51_23515 [Amaricoccus solimangrovi]